MIISLAVILCLFGILFGAIFVMTDRAIFGMLGAALCIIAFCMAFLL